jgi:uncharacterized protein (DUF58 family)
VSQPAATPKVVAYAVLTGIGLLAAVVLGDPAIVALAAPFGFALVIGILTRVAPLPEVGLCLDTPRLVEGGKATMTLELSASATTRRCDIAQGLPPGRSDWTRGPPSWSRYR